MGNALDDAIARLSLVCREQSFKLQARIPATKDDDDLVIAKGMKWAADRIGELEAENKLLRRDVERLCVHGAEPTDEEWVALRQRNAKLQECARLLRETQTRLDPPSFHECQNPDGCPWRAEHTFNRRVAAALEGLS